MDEQYHVHDLLAAYVLGAVTPEEASLVEQHLVTCALCRGQAREFRQVERALPRLAGELAPPPALKARLMSVVEAEARTRNARGTATLNGAYDRPNGEAPEMLAPIPISSARNTKAGARTGVEGQPVQARRRGVLLGPILALAAALLLVAVGVGLWRALGLGTAQPTNVYAFMAAAGTAPSGTKYGTLKYYKDGNHLALDLHGLKKTDSDHVYELWLIRLQGSKPVAVKGVQVFHASDGTGHLDAGGQDIHGYNLAGLTVERRFSPDKPTLPIVATAPITT